MNNDRAIATIGLTGGIASGKSTATKHFASLGVRVVDADSIAREVVAPGEPTLDEIRKVFGESVLASDGTLDRQKMATLVFSDAQARGRLNAIVHPTIAARSVQALAAVRTLAKKTRIPYVIYEAPLLIENGIHRDMDGVVVVDVTEATQRSRLQARDELTAEQVEARLRAQLPVGEKRAYADWLVDNNGDFAHLRAEVERVHKSICEKFTSKRN